MPKECGMKDKVNFHRCGTAYDVRCERKCTSFLLARESYSFGVPQIYRFSAFLMETIIWVGLFTCRVSMYLSRDFTRSISIGKEAKKPK